MPLEPLSREEIIRARLEAQSRQKATFERLGERGSRIRILQMPEGAKRGAGPASPKEPDYADFEDAHASGTLVPCGLPAFLTEALEARHALLLDCRTLNADQVSEMWYAWPESVTRARVACVLIVSDPQCLVLAKEGACLELVPGDGLDASPAERFAVRSRLGFIRRKYGVEKTIDARRYLGT